MKSSALLLAILMVGLLSCKKEQDENSLKGHWIRLDNPSDTLSFGINFSDRYFELKRGFEIRNGYLLPLSGSGPYEFVIKNDSIDIRASLSSSLFSHRYYFKVNGNKMEMGNFIDNAQPILSFNKLQ